MPNELRPGKRPRITLSPTLVMKDGQPFAALSTPGGDNQDQASASGAAQCDRVWDESAGGGRGGPFRDPALCQLVRRSQIQPRLAHSRGEGWRPG
jgi:hypothetical protein